LDGDRRLGTCKGKDTKSVYVSYEFRAATAYLGQRLIPNPLPWSSSKWTEVDVTNLTIISVKDSCCEKKKRQLENVSRAKLESYNILD
jgi:hypothetical protein